jgi:hypothetical protein
MIFVLPACTGDDAREFANAPAQTSGITDTEIGTTPKIIPAPEIPLPAQSNSLGYSGGNVNSTSSGLMADDGIYVYYRSESDGWMLYKAKYDGTEKEKLSDDSPCYINVIGNWVYYANYKEYFSIYRMRTDGTGREQLSSAYCAGLYVTDKIVVAELRGDNNEMEIWSMNLDGSGSELLISGAMLAYFYNNCIYYTPSPDWTLWKYDLRNGENVRLTDVYAANVSVDESGVYYWSVNDNSYNRIAPDNTETILVTNGDRFNYCNGGVYYMKNGYNNYNYYRYDVAAARNEAITNFTGEIFDGSGKIIEGIGIYNMEDLPSDPQGDEIFLNDNATSVYFLGDKIYFRGVLRDSLLQTRGRRVDCLFTINEIGVMVVWD